MQVVISLLVGFVDRAAMAWPEMVIKTHTLFMFNGCLALILALLSPEVRKSLSDTQLVIWAVGSQLGTFFNGAAHAFMAYTGQGSTLIKSMIPPNGYSDIGTGMLYFCAGTSSCCCPVLVLTKCRRAHSTFAHPRFSEHPCGRPPDLLCVVEKLPVITRELLIFVCSTCSRTFPLCDDNGDDLWRCTAGDQSSGAPPPTDRRFDKTYDDFFHSRFSLLQFSTHTMSSSSRSA